MNDTMCDKHYSCTKISESKLTEIMVYKTISNVTTRYPLITSFKQCDGQLGDVVLLVMLSYTFPFHITVSFYKLATILLFDNTVL